MLWNVVVCQNTLGAGQHQRKPRSIEGRPGHCLHRGTMDCHSAGGGAFSYSQLPASEQETDINALKCRREGNRELSDPSASAV